MNFGTLLFLLLLCSLVRSEPFAGKIRKNNASRAYRAALKDRKCACNGDDIQDNFRMNRGVDSKIPAAVADIDDNDVSVDLDYELLKENASNQLLERAVKQMTSVEIVEKGTLSPTEKFNEIYNTLKTSNIEEKEDLDAMDLLQKLFPVVKEKEPFDERKVVMKLRKMLDEEDFNSMFRDKGIGDIY